MNAANESLTQRLAAATGRHSTGVMRTAACLTLAVAASACTTTVRQVGDTHPISQNTATHAPVLDEARELRVAQTALAGGDVDVATTIYGRLVQQKPQSVPGLTGLGDTLYAVGDYTRADVYYRKAVAQDPKAVPALIGMARIGIQQRHLDNAVAAYRKVLAIQPNQPLATAGLGAALDMLGDHAGAQATMRAALDANPGDIGLSINLGLSLVMDGKVREGADMLLDVTHFPGAPAQARYDLALAYGLMGNDEEAARLLSDLPKQAVEDNLRYYATLRERRAAAAQPQAVGVVVTPVPQAIAQPAVAPVMAPAANRSAAPAVSTAVVGMAARAPAPTLTRAVPALVATQIDPDMSSGGVISGRLTNRASPFDSPMVSQPARLASQSAPVLP